MHVPVEQYGYIGITEFDGTVEEAADLYHEIKEALKPKIGISVKDFNKALDQYLKDGTGNTEVYLSMSPAQKAVFQEIKKSVGRINGIKH